MTDRTNVNEPVETSIGIVREGYQKRAYARTSSQQYWFCSDRPKSAAVQKPQSNSLARLSQWRALKWLSSDKREADPQCRHGRDRRVVQMSLSGAAAGAVSPLKVELSRSFIYSKCHSVVDDSSLHNITNSDSSANRG